MLSSLYFSLLKDWCDSLLRLQVNEIKSPGIYGGIICPACSRIHGRCADAVYPLMCMGHLTGEKRYVEAAVKLQAWSDHVSSPDGSWINEPEINWTGITVFGALSLGEALRHHGALLDRKDYDRWIKRLGEAASFIYDTFTMKTGNINYPITASAALTVAGSVLNEPSFISKGKEFAHKSLAYFSENKLLFGEGHPQDGFSQRGCRAVDIGYNVEESLPALALYGTLTGDEEVLQVVTSSLQEHLEFMLPDGAWDNSWGSRNYKWSYWGSRTSDGCQSAFTLLADRDPRFIEAAMRNTKLLKECTHDGILYGGPHYTSRGELPCIHHTFCHAKALAAAVDYSSGRNLEIPHTLLPRETAQGIKEYREISTLLAAIGPWKATITAYDWEYMKEGHPSGGSLSMLWHKDLGPVLAASLTEYFMKEASNMQRVKDCINLSLTPRLELYQDEKYYRNINYYAAVVEYKKQQDEIWVSSSGKLVDCDQEAPVSGEISYQIIYVFKPKSFEIFIDGNIKEHKGALRYWFPIISNCKENMKRLNSKEIEIIKNDNKVHISSTSQIEVLECDNDRIFNHVPGFEALPLYICVEDKCSITVTLNEVNTLQ